MEWTISDTVVAGLIMPFVVFLWWLATRLQKFDSCQEVQTRDIKSNGKRLILINETIGSIQSQLVKHVIHDKECDQDRDTIKGRMGDHENRLRNLEGKGSIK